MAGIAGDLTCGHQAQHTLHRCSHCNSSCNTCCALQAVYTALKETEQRATDVLPLWRVPALAQFLPRQRKALEAVALIRRTTEELIGKCKEMVDAEEQVSQNWWGIH